MNVVVRLLRGKLLAMVGAVTMGCGSGSDSEQVPTAVATATPSSVKPLAVRLPDHSALFDWAEFTFPNFFPSHRINAESPPYVYRYYPETGNYVGLDGDKVVVLGPVSGGSILIVGSLADFACKVYPSDCWAPTIAVAPSSSVVTLHTSAGFAVRASASPDPGYQWQLSTDGGQVFSDILGATSSAYTTPATELGHDGHLYRVVISNSIGSVTSNAARLTVSPMPVSATTRASEGVIFTPDRQDIAPGGTADFQVRLLPGYTNLQVAGCGVILNDWAVPYEHKLLTPPLASNCVMTGSATKVSLTEGPYVLYGIGQSAAATFAGATDSIVVEARASGSFNRLLAEIADGRLDGVSSVVKSRSVQLLDDGISPDRMAGDGLWTGRISIPLVAALPEYGGREGRLPIFVRAYDRLGIEIVSSAGFGGRTENPVISHVVVDMSVPSPTLTQCAANAWRGDGFVNVVASRYSINAMRDALRSCVDTSQVDFIMRFPIGDADQWDWAYANPIRNDVLGIGMQTRPSNVEGFPRLRSQITVGMPMLSCAGDVCLHEIMHTWGFNLFKDGLDLTGGTRQHIGPSNVCGSLGPASYLRIEVDGSATVDSCRSRTGKYDPLEQYLAGWRDASEVPPRYFAANRIYYLPAGTRIPKSELTLVTPDWIGQEFGEHRSEDGSAFQRDFNLLIVVVSSTKLSVAEAAHFALVSQHFSGSAGYEISVAPNRFSMITHSSFAFATDGRARIHTRVNPKR